MVMDHTLSSKSLKYRRGIYLRQEERALFPRLKRDGVQEDGTFVRWEV